MNIVAQNINVTRFVHGPNASKTPSVCVCVCVCVVCVRLCTIRRPSNPLARARPAAFEMQPYPSPAKWRAHTRTRACSHSHNKTTTSPVGTKPVAHTFPNQFIFAHNIVHRSASPSPTSSVRCECVRTHTDAHARTCTRAWAHAQHDTNRKEKSFSAGAFAPCSCSIFLTSPEGPPSITPHNPLRTPSGDKLRLLKPPLAPFPPSCMVSDALFRALDCGGHSDDGAACWCFGY